jgi:DNA polymerase III delta prime subunit
MSVIGEKFTRKYAPKSLDEVIMPERIRKKLISGPKQHMLLYGTAGTGKTSTVVALCKGMGIPFLHINSSEETSVDIIREKISKFCATMSIMDGAAGRQKVVLLDEVDGVSDQFNKALKATMERFEKTSVFLATTNHINKIPDAVKSRFEEISYNFTEDEETEMLRGLIKRVHEVATAEGITFDKPALVEFVKRKFPDMRSMLNALQGYHDEGLTHITIEDVKKFHSVFKDVYELICTPEPNPVENYKYLISNYSNKVDDILATLGNDFIEYIQMEKPALGQKIPQIIVTVAEHQAQRVNVIDPAVSMLACVYKIQSILKS